MSVPSNITTYAAASSYLDANPNLSTADLNQLGMQMSVKLDNIKSLLLFSGDISADPTIKLHSGDIAKFIGQNSPNEAKVGTIIQTSAGTLLDNDKYISAMDNAVQKDLIAAGKSATVADVKFERNKILFGEVDQATGIKKTLGMWDYKSTELVQVNVSGSIPVNTITPMAWKGGVFTQSEIKAMLDSPTPSVDGIAKSALVNMYNSAYNASIADGLTPTQAANNALLDVQQSIRANSFTKTIEMQYVSKVVNGELVITQVDVGKDFYKGTTYAPPRTLIADGMVGKASVINAMDKLNLDTMKELAAGESRLLKFTGHPEGLTATNIHVLQKAGIVGTVIGLSMTAVDAHAAYERGDINGAAKIIADYAAGFIGGVAGGLAAGTAATLLVEATIAVLAIPAATTLATVATGIAFTLVVAASVAGSMLGDSAGQAALNYLIKEGEALGVLPPGGFEQFLKDFAAYHNGHGPVDDFINLIKSLFGTALGQMSPLILDLNGDGVKTTALAGAGAAYFDHDHNGYAEASGWVGAGDGLLVLDANKNGLIDNGLELFGDQTGQANGFAALAQYDINADGKITGEDAIWRSLKVWTDGNGDGVTQAGELKTLDELKITQINLNYTDVATDSNGNTIKQNGSFVMNGATRTVSDVYFNVDKANTVYCQAYTLDTRTLFLPTLRGYGALADLQIAMSKDATATGNLLSLVQGFATKDFAAIFSGDATIPNAVRAIMYRWAGVDVVAAGSRGPNVDARELGFIEKLMGQGFSQRNYDANPGVIAGADLHKAFDEAFNHIYASLLLQSGARTLFTGTVTYNMATDAFTGITGLNTASLTSLQNEAKALATTAARQTLWDNAVRVIEFSIGTTALSAASRTALDNAIKASDATLTLAKIVSDLHPGDGNTAVKGFAGDDIITTGAGNDTVTGDTGNDTIKTGAGNDRIYGGADGFPSGLPGGNDLLTGGTGDDFIDGNVGNDTYYYNAGDGRDTYADASGADRIVFGASITAASLSYARAGTADLVITINASGSITLTDQFRGAGGIETLQFADGSTVNLTTLNYTANGTNGNDVLTGVAVGGGRNDTLNGLGGDDTLDGGAGDDRLYGGAGNDKLTGGDGNDVLQGDAGDDIASGGLGNDKYYYVSGKDVYSDSSGTDVIYFGTSYASSAAKYYKFGNDLMVLFTLADNVTVKGFFAAGNTIKAADYNGVIVDLTKVTYILQGDAGVNALVGTTGGDYFWGMDGNDTIQGNAGDDIMFGGAGNDTLNGGDGNDTMDGGAGNDRLDGGNGSDIFVYNGGKDVFSDYNNTPGDTIRMASGWAAADVTYGRYAAGLSDLVMTLSPVNGITIAGQFSNASSIIETLQFADGTAVNLAQLRVTSYGTAGNDYITGIAFGASPDDTIYGYAGDDTLRADAGNDTVYGGDGRDTINGNAGNDKLYGEAGDDLIYGGDGDDILDGGAGNDTLQGDAGNDTYYYAVGKDIFYDYGNSNADVVQLSSAWIAANVKYNRYTGSSSDLVLSFDAANSITVAKQFWDAGSIIETLKLADGSAVALAAAKVTTYGTAGNDAINGIAVGASPDDTVYGGDGNDTVKGLAGNDRLYGEAGDDTLYGGDGNDILDGGVGNDTAQGEAGNDTYYYSAGKDIFYDYGNSNADVIQLSAAWVAASVKYNRYLTGPNDLVLEFNATNSITVVKQFWDAGSAIETLKFADNSSFTMTTAKVTTYGTASNDTINGITLGASPDDTIYGGDGRDAINGGTGNDKLYGQGGIDTLTGGIGADTFGFERATAFTGIDVIKDFRQAEGDKLNLSDLFTTHPTASNIGSFVSLTASGANMALMVDKDGAGSASSFQQIATLEAVSGLSIHDLLAKGNLVV